MYTYIPIYIYIHIYIYMYTHTYNARTNPRSWKPSPSSNLSIRAVRAYSVIETRQTVPCRAIRGDGISMNSTLPLSQSRPRPEAINSEANRGTLTLRTIP